MEDGGMINDILMNSDFSTFEHLSVRTKSSYPKPFAFESKQNFSKLKMRSYYQFLLSDDIRLEDVFEWFFYV